MPLQIQIGNDGRHLTLEQSCGRRSPTSGSTGRQRTFPPSENKEYQFALDPIWGRPEPSMYSTSGRQRKLAIPDPKDSTKAFQWIDIVSRLPSVRKDPAAALKNAEGRSRAFAGPSSAPDAPLELALDMPSGNAMAFAGPPPEPAKVVIPTLPTLVHDKAFFTDIKGRGFHDGLLDGLASFYKE